VAAALKRKRDIVEGILFSKFKQAEMNKIVKEEQPANSTHKSSLGEIYK
jgi:hypothetical protein